MMAVAVPVDELTNIKTQLLAQRKDLTRCYAKPGCMEFEI
jgi:hypothetical protein